MYQIDEHIHLSLFTNSIETPTVNTKIFQSATARISGHEFTFRIIGLSHFISCRSLQFDEVLTCIPIGDESKRCIINIQSNAGIKTFTTNTKTHIIETRIWTKKHDTKRRKEFTNISHVFDGDAYTGITIKKNSYETIHTYPEFDKDVFTRTTIITRTQ